MWRYASASRSDSVVAGSAGAGQSTMAAEMWRNGSRSKLCRVAATPVPAAGPGSAPDGAPGVRWAAAIRTTRVTHVRAARLHSVKIARPLFVCRPPPGSRENTAVRMCVRQREYNCGLYRLTSAKFWIIVGSPRRHGGPGCRRTFPMLSEIRIGRHSIRCFGQHQPGRTRTLRCMSTPREHTSCLQALARRGRRYIAPGVCRGRDLPRRSARAARRRRRSDSRMRCAHCPVRRHRPL
ncbi:hypothetical protein PTE31013_01041 [Pandoraea terrigena]|uniref:Uncharacterized protein n=1 Tax=Pandoraea terrigena TaxID=2508292 RepID=A0A5E4SVU2_9BURK|nr:hypothetical protein PTE31013_01041 [Pandoraea terrigena]